MDFLQIKYIVLQNKATILKNEEKYFVWTAISQVKSEQRWFSVGVIGW